MNPFSLLLLYALFRLKHFVCDYLLQTSWIAAHKGLPGRDGYRALFIHSAAHALGTLIVTVLFAPGLWWLGLIDFVVHSVIDKIKGGVTHKMGWTPKDTAFWWAIGADQEAHNFTHLAYIIVIFMHISGGL